MTLAAFLDHLRMRGAVVAATKRGAVATCPSHEDRRPSLDVTTGRDGRVLAYCRAGCRIADIVKALGLTMGDLFAEPGPPRARWASSPLAAARAEALAIAREQSWARDGVPEQYEAADRLKAADRIRRAAVSDDESTWGRLALAAAMTTAAEAVLAE